ncbi:phosphatidate phosphatase APP1 Ecym_5359 [Eremothecium cymbalariae DBVPG|uniref:Phosphatidate phosphatase APP1 catalytic domain-containing protein n=1 Tax=Eremothecium cymbalariae (strain CBS 270.75 / DBVPG 7215 / KCTC 17166 / NRRL Y-17582) TaxID=931890 RepID=I6NDH5_ERECY|nr:hypothetical protein Ecym_5359 [Eremothecium cymbalariae DBVPG\
MWSNGENGVGSGRRQRLMNMVKTTKDVYIPAVHNSLTQAKNSLRSYYNGYDDSRELCVQQDKLIPNFDERELHLLCYPSYTRIGNDSRYVTQVRGMVYTEGQMGRRNRLIMSICRQFIKPTATVETEKELERVFNDDTTSPSARYTLQSTSTVNSIASSSSSSSFTAVSASTTTSQQGQEEVLRERISGFLNKSIPNVPIVVNLIDNAGNQETVHTNTDNYGQFQVHTDTKFLPRVIKCTVDFDIPISTWFDTNLIEDSGIGVISDIDDTIKHTGVVGDKRSLFCNVFVNSLNSWLIPGMSLWYNTMRDVECVDFFYVSNSPYQIYPTLRQYISNEYPIGPLFLKQYSGNLLSSLMTSTAKIKLPSIVQICADFPNKKFVLIGDSGEEDLEAYIATARDFPKQIIGIYIRCCKDSMSDDPTRDWKVMEELNAIISDKYLSVIQRRQAIMKKKQSCPPVPPKKVRLSPAVEEEIKKSRTFRNYAMSPVSSQISYLSRSPRYGSLGTIPISPNKPPPLPPRNRTMSSPQFDSDIDDLFTMPSTQNDYGMYSVYFDRKADEWKERVLRAINILQEQNVEARFMFFKEPSICIEDSMSQIRSTKMKRAN